MRIFFVIGDAEYMSSDQKAWRLAARLQAAGHVVQGATNEQWVADEARQYGVSCLVYPFASPGVAVPQRLAAIDHMIAVTSDLLLADDFPVWKVLAMDDFAGSLLLYGAHPGALPACDVVVLPLLSIDNNTKGACGLLVWAASEAHRTRIPVVGIEVGPLGSKQTMGLLLADQYAVRSPFARECLLQDGKTREQIALLSTVDAYYLAPDKSEYVEAYCTQETQVREVLHLDRGRFVIVVPHHVAFLWEVKHILRGIIAANLGPHVSVIIKADPHLVRRQYTEVDIVRIVYAEEIQQLPQCVIDTEVGHGLLFQAADLVITPVPSSRLEVVQRSGTPIIICQSTGLCGWETLTTCWEPDPTQIARRIQEFFAAGLYKQSLASILEAVVPQTQT